MSEDLMEYMERDRPETVICVPALTPERMQELCATLRDDEQRSLYPDGSRCWAASLGRTQGALIGLVRDLAGPAAAVAVQAAMDGKREDGQ